MSGVLAAAGLVVLASGLVSVIRPGAIVAVQRRVARVLRLRAPTYGRPARIRVAGVVETVLATLLLVTAFS